MLTPAQLKKINLQLQEDGTYAAEDVDHLFAEITKDYNDIFTENGNLIKKLSILAAKLDEYRKDENVLRDVLYNAQKSADMIINAANDRAQEIIKGAEGRVGEIEREAGGIIKDAQFKAEKINTAAEAEYTSIISSAKVLSEGYLHAAREQAVAINRETEKTVNDLIADCDVKAASILENAQVRSAALLDDAQQAANALMENAQADLDSQKNALDEVLKAAVEKAEAKANETLDTANAEAVKMLEDARAQAETQTAESETRLRLAEEEAQRILTEAKNEAALQATAIMQDVENARAMVDKTRADAKVYLETVEAEASEKADAIVSEAQGKNKALIYDAEQRAYEMLEVAKSASSRIMAEAQASSGTLLGGAKDEAQTIIETANKNSFLKLEDARQRSEQIISEVKEKTAAMYSRRMDEAEEIFSKAKEISDNVTSTAGTKAAEILNAAKSKAETVLASAQSAADAMSTATEQRANEALQSADEIIDSRLTETKRLCTELIARARAKAEEMLEQSRNSGDEYLSASRNKAASLVVAAQNECERMLKLIRSEADGGDISYVVRMPDVVQPLPDGTDTNAILSSHGIDGNVEMVRPTLDDDADAFDDVQAEESAPIHLERASEADVELQSLQEFDSERFVAEQVNEKAEAIPERENTDEAFDDLFEELDFDVLRTGEAANDPLADLNAAFKEASILSTEQIVEARGRIAAIAAGQSVHASEAAVPQETDTGKKRESLESMLESDVEAIEKDLKHGEDLDERSDDAFVPVEQTADGIVLEEGEEDNADAGTENDSAADDGFRLDFASLPEEWETESEIRMEAQEADHAAPDMAKDAFGAETPGTENADTDASSAAFLSDDVPDDVSDAAAFDEADTIAEEEAFFEAVSYEETASGDDVFGDEASFDDVDVENGATQPSVADEGFNPDFTFAFDNDAMTDDMEEADVSETLTYPPADDLTGQSVDASQMHADEAAASPLDGEQPENEPETQRIEEDMPIPSADDETSSAFAFDADDAFSDDRMQTEDVMSEEAVAAETEILEADADEVTEEEWLDFEEISFEEDSSGPAVDEEGGADTDAADGFDFAEAFSDNAGDDIPDMPAEALTGLKEEEAVFSIADVQTENDAGGEASGEIIDDTLDEPQVVTELSAPDYEADAPKQRRNKKRGKKKRK